MEKQSGQLLVYVYIEMKWQNFHFDIAGSDSLSRKKDIFEKKWRMAEDMIVSKKKRRSGTQYIKHPSRERDSTRNI